MRYWVPVEPHAIVQGLLWFAAFLFSTTVHEAAHALASLRGGDPTAYLGGQVSLSPLPHIRREPIGMLVVPLAFAALRGGLLAGLFESPEHVALSHLVEAASDAPWLTALGALVSVLLVQNVLLFVFNMLPFPPLDGASAIGGVVPERVALWLRGFTANPAFSILGIFIAWQVFPRVVGPIFSALLTLVHPADRYS